RLVPGAGLWISETWLHVSVALRSPVRLGSTNRQLLPALSTRLVGHCVMTGGRVSITVRVMVQVLALEASSLAVKVISCSPSPRLVPGAGLWLSETWLHASVTLHSTAGAETADLQSRPAP